MVSYDMELSTLYEMSSVLQPGTLQGAVCRRCCSRYVMVLTPRQQLGYMSTRQFDSFHIVPKSCDHLMPYCLQHVHPTHKLELRRLSELL